jgi:hypothetical protein|tara:strand:- start:17 stop:118 length:102 start_codon:yes stop_codon:yes gene_type:complete
MKVIKKIIYNKNLLAAALNAKGCCKMIYLNLRN